MNSGSINEQWYALQVRPRFEKVVARHLQHKGYSEYLPVYKSCRRWSDRMKEIELPLFSGYTFCKFDAQNRLPILIIPGVLSIVGVGKQPAPITVEEISCIEHIVQSGLQYEPWPFMQVGQRVVVERGPLTGLEGLVVAVKANFRLVVSLPLLQRSVAVEIDRDCVQPVSSGVASIAARSIERELAYNTVGFGEARSFQH